jgi:hypothetical protein
MSEYLMEIIGIQKEGKGKSRNLKEGMKKYCGLKN